MARITHTDRAKITCWTPSVRVEMSGPILACAIELFGCVPLEQMQEALTSMSARYEKLSAIERHQKGEK